jgi:hypothetical protein
MQKRFVANYSYLFGYSWALHACCAGWCGEGQAAKVEGRLHQFNQ